MALVVRRILRGEVLDTTLDAEQTAVGEHEIRTMGGLSTCLLFKLLRHEAIRIEPGVVARFRILIAL